MNWFINLFNKYLLTLCIADIVLGFCDLVIDKTDLDTNLIEFTF